MSNIILFLVLLIFGYVFGQIAEKRHLKSIIKREKLLNTLPAVASRFPPEEGRYSQILVTGNVVVASDYFKSFTAGLINLFGGRVAPFESLLDRARRESMLRMKNQAKIMGAEYVFNVKYETARIQQSGAGAIEVFTYGTALIPLTTGPAHA
ncbi:MAG: YbjQ family protein [Gammaproteobacteria bacterium]|nr:YbjQ family protein [Gammaproteobacteria bacterium]